MVDTSTTSNQLTNIQSILEARIALQSAGQKLVFTNGCFDVLHVGHVRYLKQARELGDALVIGLNDDESVRQLKGENRPLNNLQDRAEVLLALSCVDYVATFEGQRCTALIKAIRPHVYAKGGDYTEDSLDREEYAALKDAGSEICILSLVAGKSTTETLRKLNS